MRETFGEYIKLLRKEKGLTLIELAALLKMDFANLSKMENGKRDFDKRKLSKLAAIFDLRVEELRDEYKSDQLAKHIYDLGCSAEVLKVAEEKAEYRRTLKK
ncbi:helix-turn-helix domain-containing protein [Aquimarina sediminis]|uniref:helix-turn-helix domain-containing protein n=1 Tax=Aquimarina sediminis TaxID=2070536 RepID=UPI000CA03D02|nr:helix-turn-helix transcriptional regulator [Aquimarina sediminis]